MDKRNIKRDESIQAYFLVMKEITTRGEIEEEALFQCVIDGIDKSPINKSVLYGARNTTEFKEKLKIYEKIRTKNSSSNMSSNAAIVKKTKPKEEVRCYNCGEIGHKSTTCENKNEGA